jgi:hypothetical protein
MVNTAKPRLSKPPEPERSPTIRAKTAKAEANPIQTYRILGKMSQIVFPEERYAIQSVRALNSEMGEGR